VAIKKSRLPHREHTSQVIPGILSDFNCHCLAYDFKLIRGVFDTKKFSGETGINPGDTWSTILPAKESKVGYHVHFDGRMTEKSVDMSVRYVNGATKADPNETLVFAETIMPWLATFVTDPTHRATVWAHFEKPTQTWRARFNLPFKVTMAGAEVTIDEVSLSVPRNRFRATKGRLGANEKEISAWINSVQSVEFLKFDIAKEVALYNEAAQMFVEQKP
jgi:hypothetical protein